METLWRGTASAWECDELGHLNVRHYLAKAHEAMGGLSQMIGMSGAYSRGASATLVVRELVVRFLAEARPGAPLAIRGGVTRHDETGLTAALVLDHRSKGRPAALFSVRLDHVDPTTGAVFPWASRTLEALDRSSCAMPPEHAPRSLTDDAPADISLDAAVALGMEAVARGMINPAETDMSGRMRFEHGFGKISDSVVHFDRAFAEEWESYRSGEPLRAASAVLEARLIFRRLPKAGDGWRLHSGVNFANEKIRRLVHWVCDAETGRGLWSMETVTGVLDLETRRLRPVVPDVVAALQPIVIPSLRP